MKQSILTTPWLDCFASLAMTIQVTNLKIVPR
jgi:hypothetical protein